MKVTNNRARTATVFYKVQGKMKKMRLKPFESLNITDLVDINAVKNNMVISNFAATKPASLSATTTNIVNPYNDGLSVSTLQFVDTGTTYTQGNFAAYGGYSASTPQATFSRRKTTVEKQVKGRFQIKYN